MKKSIMILLLLFAVLFTVLISLLSAEEVSRPVKSSSQTCFSPDGGCIDVLVKEISKARLEIFVMAYSFRSPVVAQALIAAHQRGVKVEVILDKSERQEGYTPAVMIANAGIPVYLDGTHAAMNNRVIMIDKTTLTTGSFSLTSASEDMNAENLLILRSVELSKLYRENWLMHKKHSEKY